jgi:hypothetical protein
MLLFQKFEHTWLQTICGEKQFGATHFSPGFQHIYTVQFINIQHIHLGWTQTHKTHRKDVSTVRKKIYIEKQQQIMDTK